MRRTTEAADVGSPVRFAPSHLRVVYRLLEGGLRPADLMSVLSSWVRLRGQASQPTFASVNVKWLLVYVTCAARKRRGRYVSGVCDDVQGTLLSWALGLAAQASCTAKLTEDADLLSSSRPEPVNTQQVAHTNDVRFLLRTIQTHLLNTPVQ